MVKTARNTRKIQDGDALGDVDWVPVDLLASIIWEFSSVSQRTAIEEDAVGSLQIFHLVNPELRQWDDLLPVVKARLGGVGPWEELSMQDWIMELEMTDSNDKDAVASRPAVKILDFFQDVKHRQGVTIAKGAIYSTDRAKMSSKTFQGLSSVQDEWVLRWLKDWGF